MDFAVIENPAAPELLRRVEDDLLRVAEGREEVGADHSEDECAELKGEEEREMKCGRRVQRRGRSSSNAGEVFSQIQGSKDRLTV